MIAAMGNTQKPLSQKHPLNYDRQDISLLANNIKQWGKELGFQHVGICDTSLEEAESHLLNWLKAGFHGNMEYMERHGSKRSRPDELEPGTISIISVRMDYLPAEEDNPEHIQG